MSEAESVDSVSHKPLGPQILPADVENFDFEAPLEGAKFADCRGLNDLYRKAFDYHLKFDSEEAKSAQRVFAMLNDITDFHFKPDEWNNPFGPRIVMEGRRSAILDDYRGQPAPALALAAERAQHPVLKARLCDVSWLLERSRHPLRLLAIDAYVKIVLGLQSGEFEDRSERFDPALGLTARDSLKRALVIGRSLPTDTLERVQSRETLSKIKDLALQSEEPVCVLWFCEMDMDFMVSEPDQLAGEIETFLNAYVQEDKLHIVVDLWRLASRAWHRAKNNGNKHLCQIRAAELLVAHADKQPTAMQSTHWLSQAISEYHGIPDTKDRRSALKHKLVDVQSKITDEMTSFSHPIDLEDLWSATENQFGNVENLQNALFLFAQISSSSDPDKLTEDAIRSILAYPLSSLFGTSIHDHEGKTKFKTPGGGFADGAHGPAIKVKIAQHEDIRRRILVHGQIKPAKERISNQFIISSDTLYKLLAHSPFVPPNLVVTFSIGFERFFAADHISALYILTPLMENSLRHLLKLHGDDVTSFNDATQTQQDMTITVLFDQKRDELVAVFGRAIIEDIERVFLDQSGSSIRHSVAHGLLHDNSPYGHDAIYACWLIFRLCCIPLFNSSSDIEIGI